MALIFFDLDGTILDEGILIEGIYEVMQELKSKGHELAIATGRNPNLLNGIDRILAINNLVLANGSYVLCHGTVIHENYITFETIKRLMQRADSHPFDLTIEYLDEYVSYRQDTNASVNFSKFFNLPIPKYDTMQYPHKDIFAVLMFEAEAVESIKDDFPELQFNKTGGIAYDVNPSGGLKAEGVKILIDHLGYKNEDVYAFGDNYNDILMIQTVGHGIAMGNAVDALKLEADYVTDDFDKQGILKALKHYKLL